MQETKYKVRGFFGRIPSAPHALVDRVTPTADCIVLCHLGIPEVEAGSDWTVEVTGLVDRPLCLSLAQLKALPRVEIDAVHQCAGSPLAPEKPTQRVCNVVWGGVRLEHVLGLALVQPTARYVWSYGADEGEFSGVQCGNYVKDLPLERTSSDVLLAYEMNGCDLLPEHGYPVRLVVPGFYGTNSVKWLRRIELAPSRAPGPFTTTWYNDRLANGQTKPVWSIAPQSVIVWPKPDTEVRAGELVQVWGWTWSDGGVANVELSIDGGTEWRRCKLEASFGRSWQKFTCDWVPAHGNRVLITRATHPDGTSQPETVGRNAFYRVPITVLEGGVAG